MARWTGLEPATPGVTGRYSNQLSYHRASHAGIEDKWRGGRGSNPRPPGVTGRYSNQLSYHRRFVPGCPGPDLSGVVGYYARPSAASSGFAQVFQ